MKAFNVVVAVVFVGTAAAALVLGLAFRVGIVATPSYAGYCMFANIICSCISYCIYSIKETK